MKLILKKNNYRLFRTVKRLVEEATLNAGQTQAIASILLYLDPVTCSFLEGDSVPEYLDSGCRKTLLGQLVAQAIIQKRLEYIHYLGTWPC